MFAIRLNSSIPGMFVYVFRWGSRWGRAEHFVRVFPYFTDAEWALQAHISEVKEKIRFTAPECCQYERGMIARLEKAEIVFADDVPEKTAGGDKIQRQLSDDQVML